MPNLELRLKRKLSPFRKMAIGTWRTAGDPSVYGSLTLRMDEAARYLQAFREATGARLTYTHMVARAMAAVLEAMPDANALLRMNRLYVRERIGVFLQVALEDPKSGEIDLSGTLLRDPERMTLRELVEEFEARTARVRDGTDAKERSRGMMRRIPGPLLGHVLRGLSFFSHTLNLDLRRLGVPRDPFGSVMVTNIGSLGLDEAYPPLVPYSRVPLVVAVGAVRDVPVVEGGAVVPGKVMQVCATFDHRVLDGVHAAVMVKTMRRWIERPFEHFDPIPAQVPGRGRSTVQPR